MESQINTEVWVNIPNYPNYQISNLGRVKRLKMKTTHGRILEEHIHKPFPDGGGYLMCCIINDEGRYYMKVHRMVAKMFIPNPLNLPEVNHKNHNRADARSDNLEWITRVGNQRYAAINGRYRHKLSEQDVLKIRELCSIGDMPQYKIAELFNVDQSHINKIYKKTRRVTFLGN